MATVGLKGIWGLEQLDKTGIATWKLGLILMGVAGVVSYILIKLLVEMEPNLVFGPESPDQITATIIGTIFWGTGLVVISLALARAVEMDVKALALFDNVVEASIERLEPTRALRFTCIILGLSLGYLLVPISISLEPRDPSVIEVFTAFATGGPDLIYCFILNPIVGLISGMLWAIIISQINSLVHAARHIKIDFLQLNDYAAIANPGVRVFLCTIPLMSVLPLMILYGDEPEDVAFLMRIMVAFVFIGVVSILPYAYPVWILKNRIRDKKIAEMGLITRSLRGDKEAVKAINIHALDAPTTAADLLTHRMFLDSLWEWPIASHLQKLILFGLLPPLTWVVAAMIENAMY
jgi:hypothetical protein